MSEFQPNTVGEEAHIEPFYNAQIDEAFNDPLKGNSDAAANNSGVEGLSNDNLAPVGDQKGGAMSKRVSRAIMKFLRESRRGGGRKSPSYKFIA